MIDPRSKAILVRPETGEAFGDKTSEVLQYRVDAPFIRLTFAGSGPPKEYRYRAERVAILRDPVPISLSEGVRVAVRGDVWKNAREVWRFDGLGGTWWRVFYTKAGREVYRTYPDPDVRILHDAARETRAADVLAYWRSIVSGLPDDDPLRSPYEDLDFVHPESVLGKYLIGGPTGSSNSVGPMIFPFSCNLSQREAVEKALCHPISVIDGPPGTGKTQTILNLIANIIDSHSPGATVGVVSFNNAAVDNVRDKLVRQGFGYVVASLGRREKREEFFDGQPARSADVDGLVDSDVIPRPPVEQIADLDDRLRRLQETERQLAQWRAEIDAYRLELRHFSQYFDRQELPELESFPLMRRSSERILDYLAEAALSHAHDGPVTRLIRPIRGYFRYGRMRGIDPRDTDVVLRLQRAYYDKKIGELQQQIERAEDVLERADVARLSDEHRQLSAHVLLAGLQQRYAKLPRAIYSPETYRRQFAMFTQDYPVILSTCHSLRRSIAHGHLLDYLIIDEASQVNLLAAGLALASARNVVVVGDLRQLQHIADESACEGAAPLQAYDYQQHSILSSLIELYGETLPRTMLREHYRCDPAIIGFCNKKFYDGQLVPFTASTHGEQPLVVVRTAEGNHMRQHGGGGRSNQREVDAIVEEVIPTYCADTRNEDIGITTPYRRQVSKVSDALIDSIQADTVHKFQGQEKDVVIMTTVLDETWRGRTGGEFVDDPRLVNVAVSRAIRRFVLVTNHDMLPKSRNLRDLIGYIRYHDPDHDVVDSAVVSVFDLLYREYSARLRPLAARLKGAMQYKSEDIVWTVLNEILAEESFADFAAVDQVLLRNLLPDLTGLTPEQAAYVKHRSSVDFVIYNRITNRLAFAIEVDGFAYHENNPAQQIRDAHKDAICATHRIPLLRLPTTGSGEEQRIRQMFDSVMSGGGGT